MLHTGDVYSYPALQGSSSKPFWEETDLRLNFSR